MPRLSNDGFLSQLGALFSSASVKGSVWITTKQVNPRGEAPRSASAAATPTVLYRASNGTISITTHVTAEERAQFTNAFNSLLKACTPNLKKVARSKDRRKKSGKEAAAGGAGSPPGGSTAAAVRSAPSTH